MAAGFTLQDLAPQVEGNLIGEGDIIITGVGGLEDAQEGDITFVMRGSLEEKALQSKASAFLVSQKIPTSRPQIQVENPRLAFARIARLFLPPLLSPGVHPQAIIHPTATLQEGVAIGPSVVVEEKAVIGRGTILEAGTYIGPWVRVGENCHLHPRVVLEREVVLGNGVIIQAGSVVGSDGYGYEWTPTGHEKIPHLGTVIIQDQVEIGACVTIDRATTGATVIGKGTKIDNLVQIGHNVTIGPHCLVVAMVGISGSSSLGEGVILTGQVGVSDHVQIGEGTIVGARGLVLKDLPPHSHYLGVPVLEQKEELRFQASRKRIPELIKEVRRLKKEVQALQKEIKE